MHNNNYYLSSSLEQYELGQAAQNVKKMPNLNI